jgi:hypothetical protein
MRREAAMRWVHPTVIILLVAATSQAVVPCSDGAWDGLGSSGRRQTLMVRVDLMPLKAGLTDPKHDWAFLFDGLANRKTKFTFRELR